MSRRPTRITIFNHKGGVGKTTLTANVAFALSSLGKSVLLVDGDPQCNLTSHLLSDDVVDELLDRSNDPGGGTIWTAVKPVLDNTGVGRLVDPTMIGDVALLPGDIRLSEFEEFRLSCNECGQIEARSSGRRGVPPAPGRPRN